MNRRSFLLASAAAVAGCPPTAVTARGGADGLRAKAAGVTLFLAGDVMTGRGIDQILPFQSPPALREPVVTDARDYVRLAERANGRIERPVSFGYIWGDALAELERVTPDARVVNLETSVTRSDDYWPGKPIHYRMHPSNVPVLTSAGLDVCVLANNHVLDFGRRGLAETLTSLAGAGLHTAGAGRTPGEAEGPAVVPVPGGTRVIVIAAASLDSGVPREWAAGPARPGVSLLPDLSERTATALADRARRRKQAGDVVVVSIHWGSNWGYEVPPEHVRFAHHLIDRDVDVVHGHSSHHPRPVEIYRRRPILYGCGDLINDYEGITGYESFRPDLALLYFASFAPGTGALASLRMVPVRVRRMRLTRASAADTRWLQGTLDRVSQPFGSRVELADGALLAR
jgi:poly-gamma-glutamate capsule biosynthesis protein CapA/YwtB (metallophosphatase superfamily)